MKRFVACGTVTCILKSGNNTVTLATFVDLLCFFPLSCDMLLGFLFIKFLAYHEADPKGVLDTNAALVLFKQCVERNTFPITRDFWDFSPY